MGLMKQETVRNNWKREEKWEKTVNANIVKFDSKSSSAKKAKTRKNKGDKWK